MSPASQTRLDEILSNPSFRKLIAARAMLRWTASLVVLVIFFGFVGAISMASTMFKTNVLGESMPLGMAAAFGVIAAFVVVTGYYVSRSNSSLDALAQTVRKESGR